MNKIAVTISGAVLPTVAFSHPEHASGGDLGVLHYVTDPFHIGLIALSVVAVLMVRRSMLRRLAR